MIKNLKASVKIMFYQGLGMIFSFLVIQILLEYLGKSLFGVWVIVISITSWLSLLDSGVSNSLRNKLTELLINKRYEAARKVISSAYFYLGVLLVFLSVLLIFSSIYIDWQYVLNAPEEKGLLFIVVLAIVSVTMNVYFLLNSAVSFSLHRPEYNAIRFFVFQLLFLVSCWVISSNHYAFIDNKGATIATVFLLANILANVIGVVFVFASNPIIRPKYALVDIKEIKGLGSIGGQFLILQIASIALFSTDSILVAHLFDISEVASFSVSSKLFLIFVFVQGALLSPLWANYAEAALKKSKSKILSLLKLSLSVTCLLVGGGVVLVFLVPDIMDLWLGNLELYNAKLILALAMLTAIRLWCSNFSTLMNGVGDLKVQIVASISAVFVNIPLSIVLVKWFGFGLEGVAYGSVVALSIFAIAGPISVYRKIISLN